MIAYLKGSLAAKAETSCVMLTAGGVGYEVRLTVPGAASLPKVGAEIEFFVNTIVREDAIDLYGFTTWDERATFVTLLSITKLGPKTALNILSAFSPDDLRRVVISDDYTQLTQVSGIGKKSAQRIFVELKYKLESSGVGPAPSMPDLDGRAAGNFRDSLAGLTNLGYDEAQARAVLEEIFAGEPTLDVSQALREALKAISKANAQ